ncbi:MAG: hypothetical protein IPG04_30285 [Polyangiaceae bacterium]|nr:hypothetical protein [Polyangiaceae bacterium]
MAEVVIRLIVNKTTGKKDVVISYTSDSDALPVEHEEEHRRVVDRLLAGGALKAAELGEIVVTRAGGEARGEEAPADVAGGPRVGVAKKG